MKDKHQKSISWEHMGVRKTVTYVQREVPEIDEKALRRALTAKVFDKYTVKKLDRKAMEAAMDTGAIDPHVVSQHVSMKASAPYLKYTEKNEEES